MALHKIGNVRMIHQVIQRLRDSYAEHPEYRDVKYIVHDANRSKVIVSFKHGDVKSIEEIDVNGVEGEGLSAFVFNWIATYGNSGQHTGAN